MTAVPQRKHRDESTAWAGWLLFGGVLMAMLGLFQAVEGVLALAGSACSTAAWSPASPRSLSACSAPW